MKENKTILAAVVDLILTLVLITGCAAEQTKEELPDPEPLVINTVEDGDDMLLTVIREDETIFQYEGNIELWKGVDGKAYGIIYLDEEVLQ